MAADRVFPANPYEGIFPTPVPVTHGTFLAPTTGHELGTYRWGEVGEKQGMVLLVHGFGEHLGRYDHVAGFFAERGYEVVGIDHRCHGRSSGMAGAKGHLQSIEDLICDLIDFVKHALAGRGGRNFIYCHSTGALVVFLAMKRGLRAIWSELHGVVFSAPLLRSPMAICYTCTGLIRCLVNCCLGCVMSAVKPGQITRNEKLARATQADQLYWAWKINFSFVRAMLEGSLEALDSLADVTYPFLLLHSPDDELCAVSGSRDLFRLAHSKQKSMAPEEVFKGWGHELHSEEEWSKPLELAFAWMGEVEAEDQA